MRLFIAEKPSLAKAIAEGLGSITTKDGCYSCNDGKDVVTWCYGHILEQLSPEEYGPEFKAWSFDTLPICPPVWKLKVKQSAKNQFNVVKEKCKQAEVIVNAGDPDREGQLLVDEVIEYVKATGKPIKRLLLNALDAKSVKAALKDIRDNKDFVGLKNSALARSHADWLYGMNLSRAYTLAAGKAGIQQTISVGRVRTPTMSLVIRREQEIMNFRAYEYYRIKAVWKHDNGKLSTFWEPSKDCDALDQHNRLTDKAFANNIVKKVSGKQGIIRKVTETKKTVGQYWENEQ